MKRAYKSERVTARERFLGVQVTVEVGTTLRFVEIKVPWEQVAEQYPGIINGCEKVFLGRIQKQESLDQPTLPFGD